MILDTQGNYESFQYEGMERPKELLEIIKKQNPETDIGYTEKNKRKYRSYDKNIQ